MLLKDKCVQHWNLYKTYIGVHNVIQVQVPHFVFYNWTMQRYVLDFKKHLYAVT